MTDFKLLSVQTGVCQPLAIGERKVLSGIRKQAVTGTVAVNKLGLAGDEQADLSVHGGLAKAVYAYPVEHYAYWEQQAAANGVAVPLPYGFMGENLTIAGLLEADVYVGDTLQFADCVLRITQPRQPCYKFNAIMQDSKAAKKMAQTGFSGFYLSVVQTGTISARESFTLVPGERATSIHSLFKVSALKTRND